MLEEMFWVPLPRKPITVFIPYQKIDERPLMLTLTSAMADKITEETNV